MDRFYKHYRYLLALLVGLCFCMPVHAEHENLFFDNKILPIVLSASRLPQVQSEAPATVTVIDRELIEASGASQIAEIFRLVPGMQIGYARGNFPVVAYQGLTSEFPQGVQVIIDGSSIYSPLFGGVIWNMLPISLEDIERIEVIRGPNSASFGANAYQSVINITTIHPSQLPKISASARLDSSHSTRTFLRTAETKNSFSYRVSLSRDENTGYKHFPDDSTTKQLSSRFDIDINQKNTLQFNFSALDSLRQTESPIAELRGYDPLRDRNESSQFAQLIWQHNLDATHHTKTQFSFQHFDGKDKYYAPALARVLDVTGESSRWNADFEHLFRLNQNTRFVWGSGAVYESVYAPFHLNTQQEKSNTRLRLFANLESQINNKIIVNVGNLYEYDKISGDNYSPRIALNYLLSNNHTYRFVASRAFRTPTITQQYQQTFITTSTGDLQSETMQSLETGYHGIYWHNTANIDIKIYKNQYKKIINSALGGQSLLVIDNIDEAQTKGAELEFNYRPEHSVILHAGYTYSHIDQAQKRFIDSIPRHNINVLISKKFPNHYYSSFSYYYMSDMQYLGTQNDPQGGFQRLDLTTGKTFKVSADKRINISLNLQWALAKNIDFHHQATADNRIYLQVKYDAE